jgi:anaerobic magnesium-protoporphyrin IX monomethyl ester cyclase
MSNIVILVKINKPEFMHIPPLGLLYVGDALKKAGFEVKLFHIKTSEVEEYAGRIIDLKPLFVAFSVFTGDEMGSYIKASKYIKARSDVPTVWGNAHPSLLPEQCLGEDYIDFVIIGEGEITSVELARALRNGGQFSQIKGLGYKDAAGNIRINERREFIRDLDEYSLDWELVDIENYIKPYWELDRVLQFVTSRGCPHNCGFCYNLVFNNRRFRAHSAKKVVAEINRLKEKYDLQGIFFWDDNFFANKQRAFDIVSRIDLPYYAEARLDYFDEDFARKLAETKCRLLLTGAESGSDRILKLINKGAAVADTMRATKLLAKYPSVRMSPSIIFGTPTETKEEYRQTIRMIIDMFEINKNLVFTTGFYMPFPGTDLYDLSKKTGFVEPAGTEDWAKMDRWTDKLEIKWINWGSAREFARMRERIQVLGILYRYNIPFLKGLLKWRLLRGFHWLEFEVPLILYLRDFLGSDKNWLSRLFGYLLKKYWQFNKTFSRGENRVEIEAIEA